MIELTEAIARVRRVVGDTASDGNVFAIHETSKAERTATDAFRDDIRFLIDALSNEAGWRSMVSAPKDGSHIDVWVGGEFPKRITDVSWRAPSDSEWWVHGGDTIETPDPTWHDCFGPLGAEEAPTHWMPLPAAPTLQAGEE